MSDTTVPTITVAGSDAYYDGSSPESAIILDLYENTEHRSTRAGTLYLTENSVAEIIADLAAALAGSASYGALAAAIAAALDSEAGVLVYCDTHNPLGADLKAHPKTDECTNCHYAGPAVAAEIAAALDKKAVAS